MDNIKTLIKIALGLIVVALVLVLVFIPFNLSGYAVRDSSSNAKFTPEYTHSWTKAICNETQCQDYEIYCNGNNLVRQVPITGAVISIPSGWVDPRNEKMRDRVCE